MFQTEHLQEKWSPVLKHPDLPEIEDSYRRAVTTVILENQEAALREDAASFRKVFRQVMYRVYQIGTQ